MLGGDFNGHVGELFAGFEGVHGGSGYGVRNQDDLLILDFSVANKLAVANTFFQKNNSRLITFSSGGNHTQIDCFLVRRARLKSIKNTKECITQHKLLVCVMHSCTNVLAHSYSTKEKNLKVERSRCTERI